MILLALVLLPLLGAILSVSLSGARARRSVGRAAALAEFVLILAAAIRGPGALSDMSWDWASFAGWSLVLTRHPMGLLFGLASAGAYLTVLLDDRSMRHMGDSVLLLSLSGAMTACLAGAWSTALVGWIVAWAPLLVVVGFGPDAGARAAARRAAGYGALAFGFVVGADLLAGSGRGHAGLSSVLLLAGLAISAGLFPVHGWLSRAMVRVEPVAGGLVGTLASKLLLLHWIRMTWDAPLGPKAVHWMQLVAVVTVAHAALVGWTYRKDLRAVFAPLTSSVNALVILAALTGTKAGLVGAVFLASGQVVAMSGLWSCLAATKRRVGGAVVTAWFLLGLPGSAAFVGVLGVLVGLVQATPLPTFGLFSGHSSLLHARLTAVGVLVGYLVVLGAVAQALYYVFYETARPGGGEKPVRGAQGGVPGDGAVPGWFVALCVGLILGLVPKVWSGRIAPTQSAKEPDSHVVEQAVGPVHRSGSLPVFAARLHGGAQGRPGPLPGPGREDR